MNQLLWFAIAWIGGTAAILGSLMTLGSLLMCLVPSASSKAQPEKGSALKIRLMPKNYFKLLLFAIAIALSGFGLLAVFPFPK